MTEAEDGEQALQNLKKVGFDLIILDIMMPGMDGYHTCSVQKQRTAIKHLDLMKSEFLEKNWMLCVHR